MNNTIINTSFILPQSIVSNGVTTGNSWLHPNNILLVDDLFTESDSNSGSASDIIIGNYNTNLPQNAIVTGIEMKVIGYVGSVTIPLTTLDINMIDNTSGTDVPYPYVTPFTGFTTTNAEYTLGGQNYLFGQQSLTVDQVNNIKFQLIANGDLYIDSFLVNVYYYIPEPVVPPTPVPSGCMDCDSPIQLQAMYLYTPFQIGQTKFYLQKGSLQYPDGTPVQPGDVGSCGGDIDFVFDPGQKKGTGNNFEENVQLSLNSGSWTVLSSGVIEVDIGSINKRGLGFHTPYAHSADLMSDHDANSKVIISNSGKFYSRFPRLCQVDIVFSAPINVKDEGTTTVTSIHDINFIGANVQAEQDPIDPHQANVTIVSNPTNLQPTIESTTTGTTGTTPALTLSIPHTITSANYLRVGISTNDKVISSVTYNGISMNLVGQKSNGPADLKVAMYDLVNPTIGTFPIVVTMPTLSDISIVNISYLNVDTTNPTTGISGGTIGTGTAPTDSVTTTVQNAIVTDIVGTIHNVTTFAHVSPWVINGHVDAAARTAASSDRRVLLPATVSDVYTTAPASPWALLCYGVRGIATPSGGVNSVTGLNTDNTDPANPVVKVSTDGTTITGQGTPGDPLIAHTTGGTDEKVKVSATDTTTSYLDNKIEIVNGTNTTVTKTILNPGANEKIQYQINATGGSSNSQSFDFNGTFTRNYNWGFGNFPSSPFGYICQRGDDSSASNILVDNTLYQKNSFGFYKNTGLLFTGGIAGVLNSPAVLNSSIAVLEDISYNGPSSALTITFRIKFYDINTGALVGTSSNFTTTTTFSSSPGNYYVIHSTSIGKSAYFLLIGNGFSSNTGGQFMLVLDTDGISTVTVVSENSFTAAAITPYTYGIIKTSTSNDNFLYKGDNKVYSFVTGAVIQTMDTSVITNTWNTNSGYIKYNSNTFINFNARGGGLGQPQISNAQVFDWSVLPII